MLACSGWMTWSGTSRVASSSAGASTPSAGRRSRRSWGRISAAAPGRPDRPPDLKQLTHFAPKAKRVIYLHMVGGPSQLDLYDHKPKMAEWYDKDLPDSIRKGQRLTTMTSGQKRFPVAPSKYKFAQHGQSGMWVSELLPYTARMVDDMCFIRSMNTEAINHEPAITSDADRQHGHGSPLPGFVGVLRARLGQREPADLRRPGRQAVEHRADPGDLGAALVVGLPPRRTRGRLVPERWRPDPLHQQPAGCFQRGPPADARRPPRAQRDELSDDRRSRDAHPDRAVRTGLPDAVERPRPDRPGQRTRLDL